MMKERLERNGDLRAHRVDRLVDDRQRDLDVGDRLSSMIRDVHREANFVLRLSVGLVRRDLDREQLFSWRNDDRALLREHLTSRHRDRAEEKVRGLLLADLHFYERR